MPRRMERCDDKVGRRREAHGGETGVSGQEAAVAEEVPRGPRLPAILAPLGQRSFRWLWLGESISWLGDQFYFVALAWMALRLTHSGLAIGTLLLVAYVPRLLLMLVGGALSDRVPSRTILIRADLARGLLVGVIAVLAWTGRLQLWHLYAISASFGLADAFVFPAYNSLVAEVLDASQLEAGNALLQGSLRLANLLGPAPAGLAIAALGSGVAFAGDAASFFLCALLVWAISGYFGRQAAAGPAAAEVVALGQGDLWGTIVEGMRYGWRDPVVRPLLMIVGALYFASIGPLYVGVPLLADRTFVGGAAAAIGTLMSAYGGGSLLGIAIAGLTRATRRRGAWILAGTAWMGAGLILLGWVQNLVVAAGLIGSLGLAGGFVSVVTIAWFQERVKAQMRGRVMSLVTLASSGISPISLGAAALVAGPHLIGMFTAAGALVLGAALLCGRSAALRTTA